MIELLVTLAIIAILATLAAPSFTATIERWRIGQALSELESTLYYARAESIRHGGGITLERNTNCPNLHWECGWHLEDAQGNILQTTPPLSGVTLTAHTSQANQSVGDSIAFDRWGVSALSSFGWSAIANKKTSSNTQTICVTPGTRLKINKNGTLCS